MIEFKVAPRKATMGKMKGKTVYIAVPKGQQKISPPKWCWNVLFVRPH